MRKRLLSLVLVCAGLASAIADSVVYPPRAVAYSEERDTYVIVLRDEGFRKLHVYRTPDRSPMHRSMEELIEEGAKPPGDHVVLAERVLHARAGRLFVGRGGSVVASVRSNIEQSVPDEKATAIEIHGFDPDVRARVSLAELLDADERRALPRSVSFVHWYACAWLDEVSGHCVVLGRGSRSWAIRLDNGGIEEVTDAQLLAGLRRERGSDALFALGALLTRRQDDRMALLSDLVRRGRTSDSVRFHVLAELAITDVSDAELSERLPRNLDHLAPLHALAWQSEDRASRVPIPGDRRLGALRLLGLGHRSEKDLAVLLHAASDANDAHARAAVAALARRECPKLRSELRDLLADDPRHTRALARYYSDHRDAEVVPPLIDALERAVESDAGATADALVSALRKQTGIDAGRDAAGWRRWLER